MRNMNLTRIRKARGLSLQALGEMIGKDASTVHRAEKMDKTAKLETYQLCAEALGVTLADIFSEDLTPVERELVLAFRRVPDSNKPLLAHLVEAARSPAPSLDQEDFQAPAPSFPE